MTDIRLHDALYAEPLGKVDGFSFNEDVVRVFPDMIRRSVPGYNTIINQTGLLAARYAQPDSNLYDLGSSLGATSFAMSKSVVTDNCRIIAVDNSPSMINHCQSLLALNPGITDVVLLESDIADVQLEKASVIAMNFTLQFFSPDKRQSLMEKIYTALLPGGILILSEKIRFSDARQQKLHTDMYHSFKRANGYSDLEISQKRSALDNVLVADTISEHYKRLKSAGFSSSETWFQCFNFASMIALK